MRFDGKSPREITEEDIRAEMAAGLAEHLYLDYKQANYGNGEADTKEFLLDICQFANAQGGLLFIGVPELRDDGGPTGVPDPNRPLGIEAENPENMLLRFDALVAASIQERLRIESHAVPVEGGRVVLVFRIPNSTSKPHCVKRQREHVYFPIRRERHRVYLDIREVKEMAMTTSSQMERATQVLESNILKGGLGVCLHIGLIPIFFKEFLIDIKAPRVREAFGAFHVRTMQNHLLQPTFSFAGLVREIANRDWVRLGRNGLITCTSVITAREREGRVFCFPTSADILLRNFAYRTRRFMEAVPIAGPFLLKAALYSQAGVVGLGVGPHGFEEELGALGAGQWPTPELQVDAFTDHRYQTIRPLCDYIHQMFGAEGSTSFDDDGNWVGPG